MSTHMMRSAVKAAKRKESTRNSKPQNPQNTELGSTPVSENVQVNTTEEHVRLM